MNRRSKPRPKSKPKRKGPGRPCEYKTAKGQQACNDLVAAIEQGLAPTRAALLTGYKYETLMAWADKYEEFRERLTRATPLRELYHNQNINNTATGICPECGAKIAMGDWRASAHQLAIMDRERYSLKYQVEHSGKMEVSHEVGELSDAELAALIKDLQKDLKEHGKKGV